MTRMHATIFTDKQSTVVLVNKLLLSLAISLYVYMIYVYDLKGVVNVEMGWSDSLL